MNIRPATVDDTTALARMRWDLRTEDGAIDTGASYAEFEARFTEFLADALASGRWAVWLSEQEGSIVAHIYAQMVEKVPRPGHLHPYYGYITNVYTRAEYRNQGIGSRLLRHVIEWAQAQQLEFMVLWRSEDSLPYYQRLGFEQPQDVLQLTLSEY
jgi:GNAT superfamily N-acetyltransferase